MYTVDQRDAVVALENVPNSDTGAPLPRIVCNEHSLFLAFIMSEPDPDWNGTYAKGIGDHSKDMPIAVVRFIYPYAHIFGPPNDEAFAGHPLAEPGLKPYGAFEVRFSSWVRTLERMNSVHPYHQKSNFDGMRHFVFTFHDSTFECVAKSFDVERMRGSMSTAFEIIVSTLKTEAH